MEQETNRCPNCGRDARTDSITCEHCRAEHEKEPSERPVKKNVYGVALIAFLLVPAAYVFSFIQSIIGYQPFLVVFAAAIAGLLLSVTTFFRKGMGWGMLHGKMLAAAGSIFNIVVLCLLLFPFFHSFFQRFWYQHDFTCVENLKQLGLVIHMYATENEGRFPLVDNTKNNFIFDGNVLYPEYLIDSTAAMTQCPKAPDYEPENIARLRSTKYHPDFAVGTIHPDCITDQSYVYLGWLVMSDREAEAFFEAYDRLGPEDYDDDIVVPEGRGNVGSSKLNRLATYADTFLMTDTNVIISGTETRASTIPVLWDRPSTNPKNFSHHRGSKTGGHVLYIDGHVEFIRFGEKFPMTETMARLLDERPRAPIPDCFD